MRFKKIEWGSWWVIPTKDFVECFEQWKRCWENCVRSQGAYFEGDWGVIVLCTTFLVSCIFFNKCLYFSYQVAGYFLDKPRILVYYFKKGIKTQLKLKKRSVHYMEKVLWLMECVKSGLWSFLYYWHFGQVILCCGAVLCIGRCLAAPLASTH